jgi:hypothetical protein
MRLLQHGVEEAMMTETQNHTEEDSDDEDEELKQIEATVDADDLVFAIKQNNIDGANDRLIRIDQIDGSEGEVVYQEESSHRFQKGSAPFFFGPRFFLPGKPGESPFGLSNPPRRRDVETIEVPNRPEDRTKEDEEWIDEKHENLMEDWENDFRRHVRGTHTHTERGCKLTIIVEDED